MKTKAHGSYFISWIKRLLALFVVGTFANYMTLSAQAFIIFQDDDFHEILSPNILIDSDGTGTLDTSLQFGNDPTPANNGILLWDITNDEFDFNNDVNISGGLEASGNVNFSGSSEFHIREVADETTAVCTTLDELILDTTENTLYICSVTGSPGTWVNPAAASGTDLQGAYDADPSGAHRILVSAGGGEAVQIRANANGDNLFELQNSVGTNLLQFNDISGTTVDINSKIVDWDATGVFSLDSTDSISIAAQAPSNFTVATNAPGEDLTLAVTGATDSSVVVSSSGTGADAVDINATAGGITADSAAGVSVDAATSSNFTITASNASDQTLTLSATNAGAGNGNVAVTSDGTISFDDGALTTPVNVSVNDTALSGNYSANGLVDALNDFQSLTEGAEGATFVATDASDFTNFTAAGDTVQDALEAIDTELGTSGGNNDVLSFYPEYPDTVVFQDGSANNGKLESDFDSTNRRQFYRWTTQKPTAQDIDLRFRFELPTDFVDAGNLLVQFRTLTTSTLDNSVAVTVRNDTDNTTCHADPAAASSVADAWQTITITGAEIDTGCSGGALLAAGDVVEIIIKFSSDETPNNGAARAGQVDFSYTN